MGSRLVAIATPVLIVLLWPLGVLLLWLSPYWRGRDKVIGTLLLPCGVYAAWFIATGVGSRCESGTPGCPASLAYQVTHPTPWWGFNHNFGPILLILLVAVPILSAVYLEARLRSAELSRPGR